MSITFESRVILVGDVPHPESGNVYSREVLMGVIEEWKDQSLAGSFIGVEVNENTIAFKVSNLKLHENALLGDLEVLDTHYGVQMQNMMPSNRMMLVPVGLGIIEQGNMISNYIMTSMQARMC